MVVLTSTQTETRSPVGLKPTGPGTGGSVIVLGSNGRLGQACVTAFHREGWRVAALARATPKSGILDQVDYITGDALESSQLASAIKGYDVIVNAVNVPYGRWADVTPKLTNAVVTAATQSHATVIIPGNIYHYGAGMPTILGETTPTNPTTNLGKVRRDMERTYQAQSELNGFQTLILRAGDFMDGRRTGGWFDAHIAAKLHQGKVVYPGPLNVPHAWAYLPDFSRALVALAENRKRLPAFASLGFANHNITGQELIDALSQTVGRKLSVGKVPWFMLKLVSLFSSNLKGVTDMAYLWQMPHTIDGDVFEALVPEFRRTALPQALLEACNQLTGAKP